jgi:hypothetical protein
VEGTGVQRDSGVTISDEDFARFFAGTHVTTTAEITGSVFGVPLVEPFGDIRILNSAVIRIIRP